jgi:pyridoxine 4-dehydrogenase
VSAASLKLGETEMIRIGLGTNRLTNTAENVAFVREAVAAGVNFIDTAHIYAGGESEQTLGAAQPDVEGGVLVATKGGYRDGRPDVIRSEIEESLRRLGAETIGLYYLHKVDADVPIEDSLAAIKEYRDGGKIRHVGVSNVSLDQVERARQVLDVDAVQNHYNLSERTSEDIIDYCAEEETVFVPYFPLRADGGAAVREIAERHGATPAQITLAWMLRRSPATLPIPGTLSIDHLRENLGALEIELTDSEFEALR